MLLMPPMLLTMITLFLMLLLTFLTLPSSPLTLLMNFPKKTTPEIKVNPHNDKFDFVIVRVLLSLAIVGHNLCGCTQGQTSLSKRRTYRISQGLTWFKKVM